MPPAPGSLGPSAAELAHRLHRQSRRLTGPRQVILGCLQSAGHPLSCREIHAALPAGTCDLATVYRSLTLLEHLELVERFDLGDGVTRYELRRPDRPAHHHHLICRRCARILELNECDLADFERRLAARSGFTEVGHRLEFFGLCPDCQTARRRRRGV